jgi:hypothetical protein
MYLDHLTKKLFPHMPVGRRRYQVRVLLVAVCLGLVLGAVLFALEWYLSSQRK